MAERDYKKEAQWQKSKYRRLLVDVDKEMAESFIKKLNGKPYGSFFKEKIEEFLIEG